MQSSCVRSALVVLTLLWLGSQNLSAQTAPDAAAPKVETAPPATTTDPPAPAAEPAMPVSAPMPAHPATSPVVPAANPDPSGTNALANTLERTRTPEDAAGPDTWVMLNKNKQLMKVINFQYEDFIAVLDKLRGFGALATPPYTLQSQKVTGKATGDTADLKIEIKILLHTDQQVRIPLGLNQAVLRASKYEGDGKHNFSFEEGGDGYVSWLRGTPGKEHTIIMEIGYPVIKLGGETALRLGMPPSITSELTLDVDVPNAVGRVADDDARKLSTRNFATGTTQFSLIGVHGDFELAWRAADSPKPTTPTVLTATGTLLVRIDGPSIQTDARLNVSSSSGEFEQFRLRLPPGAKLLPGTPVGYELTSVPGQPAADIAQRGELISVKLSQKTSEPVEIRLRTEQSRSGKAVLKGVDLAGFEVVEAARQWGYVAVEVIGDWQVQWGKQQDIRRIEKLPDLPAVNDPIASFEYFGQPFILTAQITPRTTRVRVEPEYLISVGAQQALLDARLRYNIRGASEFALVVNVAGWEDVEVEPMEGIDDKNVLREGDLLTVPLKPARTGPMELRFKARRALEASGIKFTLPTPRATTQTTATVIVMPEDNIELTPKTEDFAGLSPEHVLPRIDLPVRQQEPLVYRGEPGPTQFSALVRVLTQTIDVDVESSILLENEDWRVEQKFAYRVEYEPIDHVHLLVPASLHGEDKPEITFDGQVLDESALAFQPSVMDPDKGPAILSIRLPAPARYGRFEIQARYPIPVAKLGEDEPATVSIPLLIPEEGTLRGNSLNITPAAEIQVTSIAKPWLTEDSDPELLPRSHWKLTSDERQPEVVLTAESEERITPGTTVVDLAWIQSWLTSSERQDRACYRFTTSEDHFDLQLPEGISPAEVQVILDGFPVVAEAGKDRKLSVTLPNATTASRRHLELQYRFSDRANRFGNLSLDAPKLLGGAWVQTTYWQVILPGEEMLVFAPDNFISEYQWGWNGLFRGRQPLYEQAELEAFVGASAGLPVPSDTNQYLFRNLGAPTRIELTTARLSLIIFSLSLLVLAAGLAVLYLPGLRQPWVLTVVVFCLLPLALANAGLALLMTQAAAIGLVLTLLAAGLRLWFRPEAIPPVPTPAETTLPSEPRSSTRSYITTGNVQPTSSAVTTIALHTSEAGE